MTEIKNSWERPGFRKDPYQVPDGYFESLADRIMSRVEQGPPIRNEKHTHFLRPWMAWVSGIAAIVIFGWFGLNRFYFKPLQEARYQETLALFVDYYSDELHEGQIAGYIEEYGVEVSFQTAVDYKDLIDAEPESAEEIIYESILF